MLANSGDEGVVANSEGENDFDRAHKEVIILLSSRSIHIAHSQPSSFQHHILFNMSTFKIYAQACNPNANKVQFNLSSFTS